MSSKLRKLKQQAYEAGKKRDWNAAMDAYAQILELDRNNPSLLNEYGDICLKAGEITKAIRQFLAAASKYRATGLLNNAQAVYKKVLRHEAENLNANWYLAEIRAAQGLMAEGEVHALKFLAASDEVSGEFKEIFLKRCQELLGLYPERDAILEKLAEIFRMWEMPLETSRASCLRACLLHRQGEAEAAARLAQESVERSPEVVNYGEYARWQDTIGGPGASQAEADVNTIALDDAPPTPAPESSADPAPEPEPEPEPTPEQSAPEPAAATVTEETSFADVASEALDHAGVDAPEPDGAPTVPDEGTASADDVARDDDGCITIDCGESASFADLMDDLADIAGSAAEAADPAATESQAGDGAGINLLDEILAEEGEDILRSNDTEQVSTIASEIGRNVGDAQHADPEAQYQQGLVYLELGLYDQAALALEAASRSARHSLQARELWGIALHRAGQSEAALAVFEEGLANSEPGQRLALGLRYHAGCILQELGRGDEAQEYFRQVYEVDAGFADVARRLRTPVA